MASYIRSKLALLSCSPVLHSVYLKGRKQRRTSANKDYFNFLVDLGDIDAVCPNEPGYDPWTIYISKSAWNMFTPFEEQFWEIKQMHYDGVALIERHAIDHCEFNLKLTGHVKMKMYFAQGYKAGRVDQCKTALGAEICNKDDKAAGGKVGMQRMGRRLCGGS